jgi:hypothetical protein
MSATFPAKLRLGERRLPIVSNAGKVEFDQNGPEIIEPRVEIGGATIHMILPPFRRHGEMLASDVEKVGRTNNVPRGKGTNCEKATLCPAS